MRNKVITIKDVAAHAGVSIATVSKLVNGMQRFSTAVEERVNASIRDLGYRQNPVARSMVTGRHNAIGFVALDMCNLQHANVAKGANQIAQQEGCSLLVVDIEDQPHRTEALLETLAMRVDGLIVNSGIPQSVVEWLTAREKPFIYVGFPPKEGILSIRTDSLLAANMLGTHLAAQGCRRVAYVGVPRLAWNAERHQGLKLALESAGGEVIAFEADGVTTEAGERAAAQVYLDRGEIDAVIGCNDYVAIGLLMQAHALGIRVPNEMCIAGFDNIEPTRYLSLTTVDMGSKHNGAAAARLLLDIIGGNATLAHRERQPFLVPGETTRRANKVTL